MGYSKRCPRHLQMRSPPSFSTHNNAWLALIVDPVASSRSVSDQTSGIEKLHLSTFPFAQNWFQLALCNHVVELRHPARLDFASISVGLCRDLHPWPSGPDAGRRSSRWQGGRPRQRLDPFPRMLAAQSSRDRSLPRG